MNRRTFLTASATYASAVAAGCFGGSGGGDSNDDQSADGGDDSTDGGAESGDDGSTDESADDGATETQTGFGGNGLAAGEAQLSIEIVELELPDEYAPWALVEVVNDGDGAAGAVTAAVEWIDDQGEVVADDDVHLETLRAGETWYAHVTGVVRADVTLEDATASVETRGVPPEAPLGVQVDGYEITDRSTGTVTIEGEVANVGEETVGLSVIARTFDENGRVLGDAGAHERELAPGERRSVTIRTPATHPETSVEDFEIILDEFP